MAGFTPVANQLRLTMPDPIGVDVQKRRNALAEREMADREGDSALYARQLDMTADSQRYNRERDAIGDAEAQRKAAGQQLLASAQWMTQPGLTPQAIDNIRRQLVGNPILAERGIDPMQLGPNDASDFLAEISAAQGVAPEAQPVPFEQSDDYKKLVLQGTQARDLAAAKHRYDMALTEQEARLRPPANGGRPAAPNLPVPALKIIDDATQAIGTADESMGRINEAMTLLESGTVDLGLLNNAGAVVANTLGRPDDSTKAYAQVKQIFEKLRNNYLLLSKGVQTEGDAKRAWNSEVGESALNSNAMAKQSLENARTATQKLVDVHKSRINNVNSNFGITPAASAPQGWSVEEMK